MLRSQPIGGTESSVIQLAEALAERGHRVSVFNGIANEVTERGVRWGPSSGLAQAPRPDVSIGLNSAQPHNMVEADVKIAWMHNRTSLLRLIRRREALPFAMRRPFIVTLSEHHRRQIPTLLPRAGLDVLPHGLGESFNGFKQTISPPPPRVIFLSQPYRGLSFLLNMWGEVKASVPHAELHVFAPKEEQLRQFGDDNAPGVFVRGAISQPALAAELGQARVVAIPGHADETFCLAAIEATACGVPVVTFGTGSLAERVLHGETGFIAKTQRDYLEHMNRLLSNDALWSAMHASCLDDKSNPPWSHRAAEWEARFFPRV